MSLSVVQRPQGYIVGTTSNTATYTKGSSVITKTSHGLTIGRIIYIENNEAIGFWYVTPIDANTFNIREYTGATVYTFVGTGSFNYYTSVDNAGHGWNSVHLPIVYKIKSTKWPNNTEDTAQTISSFSNDNGYTKINCASVLNSGISELEFVKITYADGETAVYQVLGFYSTSIVTINLPYNSSYNFTTAQYYYNNYHARVRIYAGLNPGHYFGDQKPYELITEQRIIPDSDGIVTVNINEFLKEQIEIFNNDLLKGTLQNNLDAFCQFYISYAEGYDYSEGGYTLMDYVGPYSDYDPNSVTWISNSADITIDSQTQFRRTSGGVSSDKKVYSLQSFTTNVYCQGVLINYLADVAFGFDNQPLLSADYLGIDYCWLLNGANAFIFELGVLQETFPDPSMTDVFKITYDGSNVKYYQNDILRKTTARAVGSALYFNSFLFSTTPQSGITSVQFGQLIGIEGYAVNADLPFKNLHSGYLSDYIYGSSATKLKFLTPSLYPELTPGHYFDISFINQIGARLRMKREAYQNGTIVNLFFDDINDYGIGIYRYQVSQSVYLEDRIDLTLQWNDYSGWVDISEVKTITVNDYCSANEINLTWLNHLGGFDYWVFKSDSDYSIDIESTKTVKKNIFQNWPKSYGKGADTINQQTQRLSRQSITVRAENLTEDQINDLFRIKTSPLVQIVVSKEDRRTVIPDSSSFTYLEQRNKLFNLEFDISFTDNQPSQSL